MNEWELVRYEALITVAESSGFLEVIVELLGMSRIEASSVATAWKSVISAILRRKDSINDRMPITKIILQLNMKLPTRKWKLNAFNVTRLYYCPDI